MKRIPFYVLCPLAVCILCGLFSSFTIVSDSTPVTRNGLMNTDVKQVDSCLLIYGINSATQSLSVEMYDPQLRLVHQFSEKISGFIPYTAVLQYQSETRLEFVITDHYNSKQQFIFLDKELKPYYKSAAAPKVTVLTGSMSKTLDEFRIDDYAWEIRTEIQDIGWSGKVTTTSLFQYGIKLQTAFPVRELNRSIVLDSLAVEYAKVFLVRDNKVYVYVNESTANGNQFIYCFSGLDGALIYKTRLTVKYNNLQKREDWNPAKFPAADACIYSNYYWDERISKLIVGGTWLADSANRSGLFLVQLDDAGSIKASKAEYGSWLSNPVDYEQSTGMIEYRVTSRDRYRITKMGYMPSGEFVVLSELYGQRISSKGGEAKGIYRVDDAHHYFCVQSTFFRMSAGSIAMKNEDMMTPTLRWNANHHLDSIAGFIPKQTKLDDELFADNPNLIADAEWGRGYYAAGFLGVNKTGIKILTHDSVLAGSGNKSSAFFTKSIRAVNGENCIPLVSPDPVHEQNFAEHNDYYAIDAQRLYRVTTRNDGYSLKVIGW